MSNASAHTASGVSRDTASTNSRNPRHAARRRLFLLCSILVLVGVGVAANYGPVRHYQEARHRLEKVAAAVAGLEEQKSALQAKLAKLSEAGYLESLAREELTYARPDEELYIVTEAAGEGTGGIGGGSEPTTGASVGVAGTTPDHTSGITAQNAQDTDGGEGREATVGETGGAEPAVGLQGGDAAEGERRIPSAGVGAGVPGADRVTGCGVGAAVPRAERSDVERGQDAGLLESILAAVAGLF